VLPAQIMQRCQAPDVERQLFAVTAAVTTAVHAVLSAGGLQLQLQLGGCAAIGSAGGLQGFENN
jgi:hypothetical protein